jgi:hypothetical protein
VNRVPCPRCLQLDPLLANKGNACLLCRHLQLVDRNLHNVARKIPVELATAYSLATEHLDAGDDVEQMGDIALKLNERWQKEHGRG